MTARRPASTDARTDTHTAARSWARARQGLGALLCLLALAGCAGSSSPGSPVTSALGGTTSAPGVTAGANQSVAVYIATADIPRCQSVDELLVANKIVIGALPAARKPADAVTDPHQLAGRWTTRAIPSRSIVTAADVAQPPIANC